MHIPVVADAEHACLILCICVPSGLPVIPVAVSVGVRTSEYGVTDTEGNLTL